MAPTEIATAGWYNFFYLTAVVAAAAVMRVAGQRRGWDPSTWGFATIAWVAGGVIGALVPRLVLGDLAAARTCIGAFAGATVALIATARFLRLPVAGALDATAVAIPLGGAIVRIGCFLAECCQGMVTSLPIGVAIHTDDLPRHPVQLYEASLEALLALWIVRRSGLKARPGDAFLASIGALSVIRFATEFVRDNDKLGPLSLAQWVVMPIAIFCFAIFLAPRRAHRKLDRAATPLTARAMIALVAIGAAAFTISRGVPALEAMVLLAGGAALSMMLAHRARAAAPTGVAILALQMPVISTDSTFPRIYTSIGAGVTAGAFDIRNLSGDCDGITEEWIRHHAFVGGSVELGTRRQNSATHGMGLRALGYSDKHSVDAAQVVLGTPRNPGPYTVNSAGITIVGDVDWKWLGLSAGASAGRFYPMDEAIYTNEDPPPPVTGYPALGVRLGKLAGVSMEFRIADEVPTWAPGPVATFAVAGGDSKGNRLRVGNSVGGFFVAGRMVTSKGMEILPSVSFGNGDTGVESAYQGGVMIRKWFRAERRPPDAK